MKAKKGNPKRIRDLKRMVFPRLVGTARKGLCVAAVSIVPRIIQPSQVNEPNHIDNSMKSPIMNIVGFDETMRILNGTAFLNAPASGSFLNSNINLIDPTSGTDYNYFPSYFRLSDGHLIP